MLSPSICAGPSPSQSQTMTNCCNNTSAQWQLWAKLGVHFSLPHPTHQQLQVSRGGLGALPELTITLEKQPHRLCVAPNTTQTTDLLFICSHLTHLKASPEWSSTDVKRGKQVLKKVFTLVKADKICSGWKERQVSVTPAQCNRCCATNFSIQGKS